MHLDSRDESKTTIETPPTKSDIWGSHITTRNGSYTDTPTYSCAGSMLSGYKSIADALTRFDTPVLAIDGYSGVDWERLKTELGKHIEGSKVEWIDVRTAYDSPEKLRDRFQPFLGGDDPVFGKLFPGTVEAWFDFSKRQEIQQSTGELVTQNTKVILYGPGAATITDNATTFYVDVSKQVSQPRIVSGDCKIPGCTPEDKQATRFKQLYFVDWPALSKTKESLLPSITLFIDQSNPDTPVAIDGLSLRRTLENVSRKPFRVKPFFLPGPWGGQWMKEKFSLDPDEVNYAWSYELITPENGVLVSDGKETMELPFELFMFHSRNLLVGQKVANRFGNSFPIRFDYLDTFDGGNLSLQCHPQEEYIQSEFGENYTQDETYYILDCKPGSVVHLGLQKDIEPENFKQDAKRADEEGIPFDISRHINNEPAHKHDLFMIPAGTVHCSGQNNIVLEISSTPYIYTFKIYDYLRRSLDGKLRPIHVERAFDNIDFSRKGSWVTENLVARPSVLRKGDDWQETVLSDSRKFFFDINRLEFERHIEDDTRGRFVAMNLVEGKSVEIRTESGDKHSLNYAECIIIPAAVGKFECINTGGDRCMLVKTFVRNCETR